MINFRFHLVSLIAVFLALALGVVMGATVLDQAIVDGLNSRINSVEDEADRQRAENGDLRDELDRLNAYVEGTAGLTVSGRLEGVPVAAVAVRDASSDDVTSAVSLAQLAGAQIAGVLWLEERWLLSDDEARQDLADILGVAAEPDAERATAWSAIAERLAAGTGPAVGDLLTALSEAGFVTYEPVGGDEAETDALAAYPGSGARVLLVDGTEAPEEMNELVAPATRAFAAAELPVVVAEVFREQDDGPARGARLAAVRDDDELTAVVSTVDSLDLVEGQVAAVLALADLGRGVVGQYGYGDGANGPLPEPAST